MKTLKEIRSTPMLLLSEEEIAQLDPKEQQWARDAQAKNIRILACHKHEPVGFSTRTGWHNYHCKNCGKDMSWDSSG